MIRLTVDADGAHCDRCGATPAPGLTACRTCGGRWSTVRVDGGGAAALRLAGDLAERAGLTVAAPPSARR